MYDASAKTKAMKSFNECLHRSSVILEDLCGLLLRFRTKRIGIIADIEKEFLQAGLHQKDCDIATLLWLKDINRKLTDNNICLFARLPFRVISSLFLLSITIEHHFNEKNTTTVKQIKEDIYIDNMIKGINNDEEALQLHK